ncbi:hypothetical protein SDC9_90701 [bioreactor metagenome]|uniref:Beta-lactamase class A catalytic domain-containing protein n=1 Tax=bioreactor metagenome TaxID=1076179 RepID=A0A644ZZH6_9ZZZZ
MKDIKKYLDEERDGKYSFYFEDLDGAYTYGYNQDVPQTSAGCMKLMLAVAFLKKVEEGMFSMDELVPIKDEDKKPGSGILYEFIERTYTIRELISSMLVVGDNTATYKLMTLLGVDQINIMFREMGLTHTHISNLPGNESNTTTASDMAKIIKLLYQKNYLTEKHSDYIIDLIRRRVKSKIAFYLPNKVRNQFASKTGDAPGIENEVALINTESGNFVFSIMSHDLPNSVYGMISLAKAGMMIWNSVHENWETVQKETME